MKILRQQLRDHFFLAHPMYNTLMDRYAEMKGAPRKKLTLSNEECQSCRMATGLSMVGIGAGFAAYTVCC